MQDVPESNVRGVATKTGSPCLICFVDLIGSSTVSSELSPDDYWDDYVRSFYLAIERALIGAREAGLKYIDKRAWDYRGDELIGMVFFDEEPETFCVGEAVRDVVRFLHGLRLFWLGSIYNQRRLVAHQIPRNIAAGIHYGRVTRVCDSTGRCRYVGHAVNVGKRTEGTSRLGVSSGIFVTGEVKHLYQLWEEEISIVLPKIRTRH